MYRILWSDGQVWCDVQLRNEALSKVIALREDGVKDIEVWHRQWVPIDPGILYLKRDI